MNQAHQFNLDVAQRELDSRNAQGEDVRAFFVNQTNAAIERAPVAMPDWMQPVDLLQEHLDHEAGAASEHQNAYALSQMRHDSGMSAVLDLVAAGKYVAVVSGPAHCRMTDAPIGSHYSIDGVFATREEADTLVHATYTRWEASGGPDEYDCSVYPKLPQPARTSGHVGDDDDDIPF